MNINDVVNRAGVVRFAVPPAAVSRRVPGPEGSAASTPPPETAAPAPASTTPASAAPPPAPQSAAPSHTVAEATAASIERTRAATEQALAALEARRAANTKAGVRLRIDESTQRVVTEVLNNQREIIRQLPPEELLRIAQRLEDVVGLIFDRRV